VLDRLGEEGSKRVVDDDRHAAGVGDVGDRGQVVDVEPGVADQLEEDGLRLLVDGAPERDGSEPSTYVVVIPIFGRVWVKRLYVPP